MRIFNSPALQDVFDAAMATGKVCRCKRDVEGVESLSVEGVIVVAVPNGSVETRLVPLGVAPEVIEAEILSQARWVS